MMTKAQKNTSNRSINDTLNQCHKQNGTRHHQVASPIATQITPLNNPIKHDLFTEVKFCNLSDDDEINNQMLKNSNINDSATINLTAENNIKKRIRLISNESGDSIDSGSTDKKKPEIPDGGYGWVVVFASLVVSLIADGLSFSFGLINTELLAYFQESTSKTAWISSLFFSVPLLMGPIWSNLVDKYGCRKMTILGGLVSSIGFALASLCNSIEMLMLTFGIISGLGLGIGYVTAVVSIAFWFDKKRTFATGIGASGTGIGTFLYAPLTQYLIDAYGWRGATLILAGTILNACVCGALMRDPDWLIEENRLESRSQSVTTFSNSSVCLEEIKKLLDNGVTKEAVLDTLVTKNNTEENQKIGEAFNKTLKRYRSELLMPTFLGSFELDSFCEVKTLSRRSLRHKDGVEAPSRDNLLSMSSQGPNATSNIIGSPDDTLMGGIVSAVADTAKHTFLASVETLSPTDKISLGSRESLPKKIKCSIDYKYSSPKMSRNDMGNSRFSLNENLFVPYNNSYISSSIFKKINGFRHNSLDLLSENNYLPNSGRESIALIDKTFVADPTVISICDNTNSNGGQTKTTDKQHIHSTTISGMRRLSKSKKPNNYRSNLRYNFLKDIRIHRNSIHYRGAMLNTHRYRLRASSCPNIFRNSMTTIAKDDEEEVRYNFLYLNIMYIWHFFHIKD